MNIVKLNGKIENIHNLNKSSSFDVGSIIKGRVIEITGNNIILDMGDRNILNCKSEIQLNINKNDLIAFMIKAIDNNQILITPISYDQVNGLNIKNEFKDENSFIDSVIKKYLMKSSSETKEIIRNLLKFNMPINKENIEEAITNINKLKYLTSINEDDKIALINRNKSPNELGIKGKELMESAYGDVGKNHMQNFKNIPSIVDKNNVDILNIAIKNLIKESDNFYSKKNSILTGVSMKEIHPVLNEVVSDSKVSFDLIKNIVFLIKSEMKITLNNLKFLTEFINSGNFISRDIDKIIEAFRIEKDVPADIKNNLSLLSKNININLVNEDRDKIAQYHKGLQEIANKIPSFISRENSISGELQERINVFLNKLDFINEINTSSNFFVFPLFIDKENTESKFIYFQNKRKGKKTDNLKVILSLETEKLGKIMVLCNIKNKDIDINFNVKKETVSLFDNNKESLIRVLHSYGYKTIKIETKSNSESNILDLISYNANVKYIIDLRV